MRPKPNACADCSTPIRKESTRCRPCQTRRAQKAMVDQKRIGERAMTAAEARARWVFNNPEKARESARLARERIKRRVDQYKAERGCEDCGNDDPRVLDLHHRERDDKVAAVNNLRTRAGVQRVMEEAAKCEVLCANCHRIRHATENDAGADIQMTTGTFFRAS